MRKTVKLTIKQLKSLIREAIDNDDEEYEEDDPLATWLGGGGGQKSRDAIKPFEMNAKDNALKELASLTKTRRTSDGKFEFLLHRGMDGYEYQESFDPQRGVINHHGTTSWTTDLSIARAWAREYDADDRRDHEMYNSPEGLEQRKEALRFIGADSDEEINAEIDRLRKRFSKYPLPKPGQAVSAWIHEDHIRNIPFITLRGTEYHSSGALDGELEVIVEPNHNSRVASVK